MRSLLQRRTRVARNARVAFAVGGLGLLGGCAAQSQNLDDRDWTVEHGLEAEDSQLREPETLFQEGSQDVDHYNATPRGVRHDLAVGAGAQPDTRCSCLDVVIGLPSDPRFAWAEGRPVVAPDALVAAVSTEGSSCAGQGAERRPSIQGVEVRGDDVILVIEELGPERPQALGAIVAKPGPDGRLWVRSAKSRTKALPYARSGDPKRDMCLVQTQREIHHRRAPGPR